MKKVTTNPTTYNVPDRVWGNFASSLGVIKDSASAGKTEIRIKK